LIFVGIQEFVVMIYDFGPYRLDTDRLELYYGTDTVATEPQVFKLIQYLIENRNKVVSKDELIDHVWEGRIVSDAALSSRINAVRRAVGDTGKDQTVIKTMRRRGFRFVAPIEKRADVPKPKSLPLENSQSIQYCTTADGIDLAYSFAGSGPTLLKVATWANHLEYDWSSPIWGPLFRELAEYRKLVRYDGRGVGLSDWNVKEITFLGLVSDLEAVIEASGTPTFALLGISQGAAVAIDYTVRNPDRVTHLILWGGFARGRRKRGQQEDKAESEAYVTLMSQGWGKERSPFREMFASRYLPEGNDEQIGWWIDMQRVATSPDNAIRLLEAIDNFDVSGDLSKVRTPTLILHSESELVIPFAEARFMAARIPDARFVPLDSTNHLVLRQETAWQHAVSEIRNFLGAEAA
jgi:DNA-binding winged helix-turn-helix (wHTH) protein/alpha-beta hydrolase superfamily lysophospholipase